TAVTPAIGRTGLRIDPSYFAYRPVATGGTRPDDPCRGPAPRGRIPGRLADESIRGLEPEDALHRGPNPDVAAPRRGKHGAVGGLLVGARAGDVEQVAPGLQRRHRRRADRAVGGDDRRLEVAADDDAAEV